MITHKFREVTAFTDKVSVLRRGKFAGGGTVGDLSTAEMSRMMIGEAEIRKSAERVPNVESPVNSNWPASSSRTRKASRRSTGST
jgi:ABC-type uncharacterized transport system ATPase subunit